MEPLDPALIPAPTFKNRRPWLIAFGVLELLIAAAFLLIGLSTVLLPQDAIRQSQPPGAPPFSIWPIVVMYAGLGTIWDLLGIGTIAAKNWARIGSLIATYFWLITGVISMLVLAVMSPSILKQAGNVPQASQTALIVGMLVVFGIVLVLLPVVFLIFLHGRNVRATCLAGREPHGTQRPTLIIVLMALFALSLFGAPFSFFSRYPAVIFGFVIWGVAGKLIVIASLLAEATALWGYSKGDVRGCWVAVVSSAFWVLSYISLFVRHQDVYDLYEKMSLNRDYMKSMEGAFAVGGVFVFILVMGRFVAIIYSKRYFPTNAVPLPGEPII